MSASKDKILRRQRLEAGLDKRAIAAEKEAKARRRSNIQYTVIGIVLVLVFAFIFFYNSALPSRMFTAAAINGENYSVAQLNYYYSASYNSYYNENYYDVLLGNAFDTSASLADQEYSEGYTWRDYFLDQAIEDMEEIQLLNELAEADGFVLPDDYQTEYDATMSELEEHWSDYGYSSLQQYINLNYGKGVTIDLIRQELYRTVVADAYAESLRDAYEYTDAQLDAVYAEHADEYDVIDYAYYLVDDETVDADELAAAVDGTSEEEFTSYMEENYDGLAPTTLSYAGSDLSDVYSEWLLDPARQAGDAAALSDEDGDLTYVVMFLGRDTNDYSLVAFRHILITTDNEEVLANAADDATEDDLLAAAEARAQEIYDEWQAGDANEDSFAELANQYTDDTGSSTNGGLYEDVSKGRMVAPINDWIFDDARKSGDTTIVTNDGSYVGAHIVYFVGADDETYAHTLARDELSQDDYEAWLEDAESGFTVSTSHLRMVGKHH